MINSEHNDDNTARGAPSALTLKRRRLEEIIVRWTVTLGGVGVILCIALIIFFIALEAVPLWRGASASLTGTFEVAQRDGAVPLAVGIDEYGEITYTVSGDGAVSFYSAKDGSLMSSRLLERLEGAGVAAVTPVSGQHGYALATDTGFVLPIEIKFLVSFDEGGRRNIEPWVYEGDPVRVSDGPLVLAAYASDEEGGRAVTAAVTAAGALIVVSEAAGDSIFTEGETLTKRYDLTPALRGSLPTQIAVDDFIENIYLGTNDGRLFQWHINDKANPSLEAVRDATPSRSVPVTALGFLLGGRSLVVGDAAGGVSVWFSVEDRASPSGRSLMRVHTLSPHDAPVTRLAPSFRNRGLISGDAAGKIIVHHATSERKLLELVSDGTPIAALAFAPRADGIVSVTGSGTQYVWALDNPHPEVSIKTLFGKVWYEGYPRPEYVWQSTGGTDEFEPKFSLTPLAYGTLKGTFYALLIAIPLAVLSAICASQFMHPSFRALIKPVIEIMAALPSVVLGFLAGLWLAPLIENYIPGVILWFIIMPPLILLSVFLWRLLPKDFRLRFRDGGELFFLIPVVIGGVLMCYWLNGPIQSGFFAGDYREWLFDTFGLRYDQRNALIVGFAMGFAVIPIIFTISEDALSYVPRHLISGSLALGATRWQTALRVVLPTASPGIFSAIMIGLGRAAGETMIVLMATGNTPIMDWSIFDGFRTLSANIAVEIPEAPHGGTLYRVLFLAAFLLFVVTFLINTVAEVVRMRIKKKYGNM
ncbi:MAG: ABC transporter permease subunit [Candidatus Dadabacteria bacterium]|nr:ABC transporter permease subunit [Candidatus Dadabacteria bacterium]